MFPDTIVEGHTKKTTAWRVAPSRQRVLLTNSALDDASCPTGKHSVISYAEVSTKSSQQNAYFGRIELIKMMWSACGCRIPSHEPECEKCKEVSWWARRYLPRQAFLQFCLTEDESTIALFFRLQDHYPLQMIRIGSQSIKQDDSAFQSREPNEKWLGPYLLHPFESISLLPPSEVTRSLQPLQLQVIPYSPSISISMETAEISKSNLQLLPSVKLTAKIALNETQTCDADSIASLRSYQPCQFLLYFVPKGTDMHSMFLHGNAKTGMQGIISIAKLRGAKVLDFWNPHESSTTPTHLVVSETASPLSIAKALGFEDDYAMSDYMQQHNITCATRSWILPPNFCTSGTLPALQHPTLMQQKLGFVKEVNNKRENPVDLTDLPDRKRVKFSERNIEISQMLQKLSKLHQSSPLLDTDLWRSYTWNLLAGRVRHFPFDIVDDPKVWDAIKQTQAFGSSAVRVIQEFVQTGQVERIINLETDPMRVAVRTMMKIWGVGRATALELVMQKGYRTLDEVRASVEAGTCTLDRNQYIGLICYEDIQEEMERQEVEMITSIVAQAVRKQYPDIEVQIMGSYRRGKSFCGDVDILLLHEDHIDVVPPQALGTVVDDLKSCGHIAHHLTFISGMRNEDFESLDRSMESKLTNPRRYGLTQDKSDKYSSSSYMGVFHSPVVKGRVRRVDIKFFPYKERAFATLYFTGNGYFNRSMRLWATRKFQWRLTHHGLYSIKTGESVFDASTEKEVFDKLDLVWKEPHERDCFDAVIGKSTGEVATQLEFSQTEILKESQECEWID
jgi:DNA polymerase/3'-5' exonuclease PolX